MPYPKAHWFVAVLLVMTVVAFWPGYFSRVGEAPTAHHVHGITSTLWMVWLALQSWCVHNGKLAWHRTLGKTSLVLYPLLMAGFLGVMHAQALNLAGGNLFFDTAGFRFTFVTSVYFFVMLYLYYSALANRSNLQLHARFMLATPFLLWDPVMNRLLTSYMPGLIITSPDTFYLVGPSLHISQAMAVALAAFLVWRAPQHGRPFLVIIGALIVAALGFNFVSQLEAWKSVFGLLARPSLAVVFVIGAAVGSVAAAMGWRAGK